MITLLDNAEFVLWNHDPGPGPSVEATESAMREAGLNPARAEGLLTDSSAFTRAYDALRNKATLITWFKHNKLDAIQVDRQRDFDGNEIPREFMGTYLRAGHDVIRLRNDSDREFQAKLSEKYAEARINYEWGDITKLLRNTLDKDSLGSYPLRDKGGVYVVPHPAGNSDVLSRCEAFSERIGVDFVRIPLVDSEAIRRQIRQSITDSLNSDLDEHEASIAEYTEDTRLEIFSNRKAGLGAVSLQVIKLMSLLNGSASELMQRVDGLLARITELERCSQNRSAAPARRILMPT